MHSQLQGLIWGVGSHCTLVDYTGWHRINRTVQPFNRVYKNLHKILPLTLVVYRQTRRQKRNVYLNYYSVRHHRWCSRYKCENASVNKWRHDWALIFVHCELKKDGEWPPSSPRLNPMNYSIWGAIQQHLKEVLQTCWEQIGQDIIDRAIGHFRGWLSLVVATGGALLWLVFWCYTYIIMLTTSCFVVQMQNLDDKSN